MRPLPFVHWIVPGLLYLAYLYAESRTSYEFAPVLLWISAGILMQAYSLHVYESLKSYVDTTMTNRWRDILNVPKKETK